MSEAVNKALMDTMNSYELEDSKIKVPTLAFYAFFKGLNTISDDWMTEAQKAGLRQHVETRENDWTRESIELIRRNVPHARIVEIHEGHHYCFIMQEELVYEEMCKFLLDS